MVEKMIERTFIGIIEGETEELPDPTLIHIGYMNERAIFPSKDDLLFWHKDSADNVRYKAE